MVYKLSVCLSYLKFRVNFMQHRRQGTSCDACGHINNQVLNSVQQILKSDERALCLNVGVFGKVATSSALLGTVALCDAEDIAKGGNDSFEVQLRTLSEVCRLSEVVQPKKCRPTLALSLHECWWGYLKVTVGKVMLTECLGGSRTKL